MPTVLPICIEVETTPEAAPTSWLGTPDRMTPSRGENTNPPPAPNTNSGGASSYRLSPIPYELRVYIIHPRLAACRMYPSPRARLPNFRMTRGPRSEVVMKPMLIVVNASPEVMGEKPRPDCKNWTRVK